MAWASHEEARKKPVFVLICSDVTISKKSFTLDKYPNFDDHCRSTAEGYIVQLLVHSSQTEAMLLHYISVSFLAIVLKKNFQDTGSF